MSAIMPELYAMQTIADAVADLTPAERKRVAAWLSEYAKQDEAVAPITSAETYVVAEPEVATELDVVAQPEAEAADDAPAAFAFDTFAEFYNATTPKTGAQKAAVAGYWLEKHDGLESWKVFEVNRLLKSIDIKVSSMSIVLTNAIKATPALVEELGRLGDGERARKCLRLSSVGNAYVEGLFN